MPRAFPGPRLFICLVAGVLGSYLLVVVVAFALQRGMLFAAPEGARVPALRGATLLHLPSPNGPVSALYSPAHPGLPTVVHFHGNAERLTLRWEARWRPQTGQSGASFGDPEVAPRCS